MTNHESPLSNDETLDLLLDEWEEAMERGDHPAPEIICREYPHLLPEFINKTHLLSKVDGQLNQDAAAVQPPVEPLAGDRKIPEPQPAQSIDWKCHVNQLNYHAHGGLGIVYRGFDMQLHRDVAIKFIRERRRHNPLDLQRFRVEAEITSRLDHPGVVPVHGYGKTDGGVPFYTMRMVEGQTLQERIDDYHQQLREVADPGDRSVGFRKLLTSFISVCNTIEYAHNRGVINCDIKPGNIMLGKYGETVVLDWGCAKYVGSAGKAKSVGEESLKPLSDTAGTEASGSTGGTPIYMSPEQHTQSEEIGPASDIYGLGVTLYRLLTGQPAFSPEFSLAKIRESVIRGKYRKPTELCPWISKALEAICLKAMALAPEDRYQSAAALARDLERYLADEEVTAYVEPWSRRMARLMRRHRGVSQVLLMSVLSLIVVSSVFAVVMGRSAAREGHAREQATEMRNRSLQLAARSAATSMALKINDAWRVLEIESNSPTLLEEMAQMGEENNLQSWKRIQDWLLRRAEKHAQATQASTWFLCKADGTQVARYPLIDEATSDIYDSIGVNFSHRDYFHGNGRDFKRGEQGQFFHIHDVHLSAVYQSSNTADLKVAFSVPIWAPEEASGPKKFLGVLGYSVELGQFAVLQDEIERKTMHQISMLIDLRKSRSQTEKSLYGAVLHHQELDEMLQTWEPDLDRLPRLENETLKSLEAYRMERVDQIREAGFAASTSDVLLLHDFQDPLGMTASGSIIAACEPVCVVGRPDSVFNTGWLVIVEEFEILNE